MTLCDKEFELRKAELEIRKDEIESSKSRWLGETLLKILGFGFPIIFSAFSLKQTFDQSIEIEREKLEHALILRSMNDTNLENRQSRLEWFKRIGLIKNRNISFEEINQDDQDFIPGFSSADSIDKAIDEIITDDDVLLIVQTIRAHKKGPYLVSTHSIDQKNFNKDIARFFAVKLQMRLAEHEDFHLLDRGEYSALNGEIQEIIDGKMRKESAPKRGDFLPAQFFITGNSTVFKDTALVTLQIVETETTSIIFSKAFILS